MTNAEIAHQRLHNQLITQPRFDKPEDVVRWLGAVQAQDYEGAKWAIGLRLPGATDEALERAMTTGAILRTHIMRPTWHFVVPEDIRSMLALTSPRVHAANAYQYRQQGLDDSLFARSNDVLATALQGGKQLIRPELVAALKQAGIVTGSLGCIHLLMYAELEGLICSGARRGKQFTYTLLAERAPQARAVERDEALAALTRRYFTSHGPATVQDFVWWSGLTAADARLGLELVKEHITQEMVEGRTYWLAPSLPAPSMPAPMVHLLPAYDEYTVGYTDRSAVLDPAYAPQAREGIFSPAIAQGGLLMGTWKRALKGNAVVLESTLFQPLGEAERQALAAAAESYGRFLGKPVKLV